MIKEAAEERKARKRAEQQQQETEDELNAYRQERESRLRAEASEETKVEDSPFTYLLQKARDKSSSLEDNILLYKLVYWFSLSVGKCIILAGTNPYFAK